MVLSEENKQSLTRTLAHLDNLTAALAGRSGDMATAVEDLAATMRQARDATTELPELFAEFGKTAKALQGMADELRDTGTSVGRVVRARDRDLQRFTGEALPEGRHDQRAASRPRTCGASVNSSNAIQRYCCAEGHRVLLDPESELLNLSLPTASAVRRAACRWPPLFLPGVFRCWC